MNQVKYTNQYFQYSLYVLITLIISILLYVYFKIPHEDFSKLATTALSISPVLFLSFAMIALAKKKKSSKPWEFEDMPRLNLNLKKRLQK